MDRRKVVVKVNIDGAKFWHLNGQRHRCDGPAIEDFKGNRVWYCNGNIHRADGPAILHVDGYKSWHLFGEYLTEGQFTARTNDG